MGIVGQSDFEEAERQQAEYCEMVKLWKQTKAGPGLQLRRLACGAAERFARS